MSIDGATGPRYLLVVAAEQLVTVALPARGELVIGRDADCDVTLDHAKVSRRHARILVDQGLVVEDLGSTNGLKVRGERVAPVGRASIAVGDAIAIGPFTAIVLAGPVERGASSDGLPRAALAIADPTIAGKTELLERIARHGVNVLIQGETGTGKEVLARTVHALSGRPGELVAINCAAISGPLLESELFGHERGAFTGATRAKPGLLEVAGKGTVLLDEIGDLPLELQGKLLRALESRQVYRVGGVKPIQLEARIISATHRRLVDEIGRDTFREDLYFRLNGITLELPPLRERRHLITGLVAGFLGNAAPRLSLKARAALSAHDWPGNVRELRQVVERAQLLAGDGPIELAHVLLSPPRGAPAAAPDRERDEFVDAARTQRGNISAIARALGTSRSQVRRLAERYGVALDELRR